MKYLKTAVKRAFVFSLQHPYTGSSIIVFALKLNEILRMLYAKMQLYNLAVIGLQTLTSDKCQFFTNSNMKGEIYLNFNSYSREAYPQWKEHNI